jgi:hypothetical protein
MTGAAGLTPLVGRDVARRCSRPGNLTRIGRSSVASHRSATSRGAVILPAISLLAKFYRLPSHDRLLLLKAMLWLAVASLTIAVLPFRYIGRLAACPSRGPKPPEQTRLEEVGRVRWAIIACGRRVPWRAMCFQQGLAAQFMLRRRGVPSVLHYGAAPDDRSGLSAHVWVRDGDVDVIGGENKSHFALLATFPPEAGSSHPS